MYKKYTNFLSLNSTRKQEFPADPLSEPHGPPGVRGPQFGKHWSRSSMLSRVDPHTATKFNNTAWYNLRCRPRQQKFNEMNGAHLASPIRGELGYAHWPQLHGNPIYCPIGNQIWSPLGKEDVCPNFALTVGKVLLSNSGNFRAKANPPKPRSSPKRPFGQLLGPNS